MWKTVGMIDDVWSYHQPPCNLTSIQWGNKNKNKKYGTGRFFLSFLKPIANVFPGTSVMYFFDSSAVRSLHIGFWVSKHIFPQYIFAVLISVLWWTNLCRISMNYVVFCVFTIAANDKNQHADNYCKPSEYICHLKIGLSIFLFSCPLHVAFLAKNMVMWKSWSTRLSKHQTTTTKGMPLTSYSLPPLPESINVVFFFLSWQDWHILKYSPCLAGGEKKYTDRVWLYWNLQQQVQERLQVYALLGPSLLPLIFCFAYTLLD